MNLNTKWIFPTLLLLAGFLPAGAQSQGTLDSSTILKTGSMSPDFSFWISRRKTSEISAYKGKIVLLDFWATWCGPCMHEMPLIEKEVWDKYRHNPRFALLAFAREQDWHTIDSFRKTHPFTFPLLQDTRRHVYGLFATEFIPRNIILDENGQIIFESVGFTQKEFDKMVALLDTRLKQGEN